MKHAFRIELKGKPQINVNYHDLSYNYRIYSEMHETTFNFMNIILECFEIKVLEVPSFFLPYLFFLKISDNRPLYD